MDSNSVDVEFRSSIVAHCQSVFDEATTSGTLSELSLKVVMERLKEIVGRKVIRAHKELAKAAVREVATAVLTFPAGELRVKSKSHKKQSKKKRRHSSDDDDSADSGDDGEEAPVRKTKAKKSKLSKKKEKKQKEEADNGEKGAAIDTPKGEGEMLFDSVVSELKWKRATKSTLSEEQRHELEQAFADRMLEAAQKDQAAWASRTAAATAAQAASLPMPLAKLDMLEEVRTQLSSVTVANRMVESSNLLRCFSAWLQPDTDADGVSTLPNIRIRTVLYKLLVPLHIVEQHLVGSDGLGNRLMRNWENDQETPDNKRLLHDLLQKWMRPILGIQSHYGQHQVEHEQEMAHVILNRKAAVDLGRHTPAAKNQQQLNRDPRRAQLPQQATFDYAFRPQTDMDEEDQVEREKERRAEAARKKREPETVRQQFERRFTASRRSATSNSAAAVKFKVDVTGRSSTFSSQG